MSLITSILTGGTHLHQSTSEEANALATDLITPGVVGAITNTSGVAPSTGGFAVNAQASPNMTIRTSAGVHYITATPTGQTSQIIRVKNTANIDTTLSGNSTGGTRYDWVYIKIDPDAAANPAVNGDNVASIYVSRSSSQVTDDNAPPSFGKCIAVVTVTNGASSIVNSNIRDFRLPVNTGNVPVGAIQPYAGSTAPAGWLLAAGQTVSRAVYAALFAVLSTTYGAGDGSTTFGIPDLRGRSVVGADNMGGTAANRAQRSITLTTTNASASATVSSATGLTRGMFVESANVPDGTTISTISGTTITMSANATATASGTAARFSLLHDAQELGQAGGSDTHTLVIDQLASHDHPNRVGDTSPGDGSGIRFSNTTTTNSAAIDNTGGDQPHPNMQPSLVLNYIVKA